MRFRDATLTRVATFSGGGPKRSRSSESTSSTGSSPLAILTVDLHAHAGVGDVLLGNGHRNRKIDRCRGRLERLLPAQLAYGLFQHLEVGLDADLGNVAALLRTEQVAGPSDLEIARSDPEARPEVAELSYRLEPLAGDLGERFVRRYQQIDYSSGTAITTTYHNDIVGLSQALLMDDGTTQTANLFGLDLIASDDGTTTLTMLPDGLGSVRVEMLGETVSSVSTYEPYGTLLMRTGPSGTVYGYTGEQMDAATGLTYLRARYYNPILRAFNKRDTWSGDQHQPVTLNGYNYANGNPITFVDHTGKCGADTHSGIQDITLDEQCIALRNSISAYYHIDIYGKWKLSEMKMMFEGLKDLEEGFGGRVPFFIMFGDQIDLFRGSGWTDTAGNHAVTNTDFPQEGFIEWPDISVDFYDASLTSPEWGRWAIIHELGHVFDNRRPFWVGNYIDQRLLDRWNSKAPSSIMHEIVLKANDFGYVSNYAASLPTEDFAESWASYFFRGSWSTMNSLGRYRASTLRHEFIDSIVRGQLLHYYSVACLIGSMKLCNVDNEKATSISNLYHSSCFGNSITI